jgi:ribose transport system substrate-binding protein
MKFPSWSRKALAAAAVLPLLAVAACSTSSSGPQSGGDGASGSNASTGNGGKPLTAKELCGDKPIKMAHVDGFGGNSWRRITKAELADEMSACPNVKITYAQTDGDLQKYITAINSFTAQGYDAIVTYDDFGSQALGALKAAHNAGVVVEPFIADPGGKVGTDYDGYVQYNFDTEGDTMAKWLHQVQPKGGKLLFTGGLPGGSPSTVALQKGIAQTNTALGSPFAFLQKEPVPSGWDPAVMQKTMSGILTKYPEIDAWASDYGVADIGGIRSMLNAGKKIPPLATSATDNELGCLWLANRKTQPQWQLLTMDGTTTVVRIAGRKALAAINKKPDNEPSQFDLDTFVDTANGKPPKCEKALPPDADLSSGLSSTDLAAVFK